MAVNGYNIGSGCYLVVFSVTNYGIVYTIMYLLVTRLLIAGVCPVKSF
jgi:hypothetical protein